ncbi:MAG: DUF131 domain-containing protein [Thaumarchaeota archaeon]|nr:DUF131 domain-containing protein [Nitrososphaerota archaeon]
MNLNTLYLSGFILVFAGLAILVAGSVGSPNTSAAVVVFVGPVPLVIGSGPYGSQLALISLVASVAIILLTYLWLRGRRAVRHAESEIR